MLNACGFDTDYSFMANVPLWFLVSLFWCRIMNALSNKNPKILKPIFIIICLIISITLWKTNRFLPFSFGASCMAFPIYWLGSFLKDKKVLRNQTVLAKSIMLILGVCVTVLATILNGQINMNGIVYGRNPFLFFFGAFSGILMMYGVSSLIPSLCSFGKFLAKNTITILAFHSIISGILLKFYAIYILHIDKLGEEKLSVFAGGMVALLCLLSCAIPCFVTRKMTLQMKKYAQ